MNANSEGRSGGEPGGETRDDPIFLPWRKFGSRLVAFLIVVAGIILLLRYFIDAIR